METIQVRGYERKISDEETAEAKIAHKELQAMLPKGKTVYTIFCGVSASGMTRWVNMVYAEGDKIAQVPPYLIERAFKDWPYKYKSNKGGWEVPGVGMDAGFELVYTLSRYLYGDGYALEHRWL